MTTDPEDPPPTGETDVPEDPTLSGAPGVPPGGPATDPDVAERGVR